METIRATRLPLWEPLSSGATVIVHSIGRQVFGLLRILIINSVLCNIINAAVLRGSDISWTHLIPR